MYLLLVELHEQRACVSCACGAQVKAGHQVAYLKALLQEEDSLPSQSVKLIYQGRSMIDPLSLADYPGLTAGAAKHIIEVKVRQLFAMTTLAITHIHVSRCSARFFPSLRGSGSTMRDNASHCLTNSHLSPEMCVLVLSQTKRRCYAMVWCVLIRSGA